MRLSNLHQNQRRMCTMWVSCFLWVCIFWRIIQVPDYSVLYFSFSETKGVRRCVMQTCRVGHVGSDGVLHARPLANEQFLSLKLKLLMWQRGRGEWSQEENVWDAYHRRARRRLFQVPCYSGAVPRTNSLTVIDVHSTVLFCTTILLYFPR